MGALYMSRSYQVHSWASLDVYSVYSTSRKSTVRTDVIEYRQAEDDAMEARTRSKTPGTRRGAAGDEGGMNADPGLLFDGSPPKRKETVRQRCIHGCILLFKH